MGERRGMLEGLVGGVEVGPGTRSEPRFANYWSLATGISGSLVFRWSALVIISVTIWYTSGRVHSLLLPLSCHISSTLHSTPYSTNLMIANAAHTVSQS